MVKVNATIGCDGKGGAMATQAVEEKEVTTREQESNNKDTRIKDETDSGSGAWGAPEALQRRLGHFVE